MPSYVDFVCEKCGKEFKREQRQVSASKDAKHWFCGKACSASYTNKHKEVGERVSKFEKWMQVRVTEEFPGLEVHFNKKDTIESELDIYIPSLKLAFEAQGPTHYLPIYGDERLAAEQKNDQEKRDICKAKGIELIEVDISKVKTFTRSLPFMMAVSKILDTIRERLKEAK